LPITKSAKKSLRTSVTKRALNEKWKISLSKALKNVTGENLSQAISVVDKAAKHNVIHENKAARIKSRLDKKFNSTEEGKTKETAKPAKKATKATKPVAKKSTAKKTTAKKATKAKK